MMNIRSYAKVNLFLLVKPLNKKNKLHDIKSCFALHKDLFDEIIIEHTNKNIDEVIYYWEKKQITIKDCLITKTLKILRENNYIKDRYKIIVNKNIPVSSGLGGGSSNAASIVKALVKTNKKFKPNKKLIDILHNISSDMIFFLYDYDYAIVKNFGKKVKKHKFKNELKFDILLTKINCETSNVFKTFDTLNLKNLKKSSIKKELTKIKKKQYNLLVNNLLVACLNTYPSISEIYNRINKEDQNYLLSGSGGTFFKISEVL
ncbi:GHMP family kinase ATP-binding protein [Malacoplasma iowae]|uniref:GHMP family kinase ATP-binding protein n=1 Tax=Malacoplasma iowae TaxID=2116 RepID=UPI002A189D7A|nr:hypothetical protein [Malacoplasma iowae]WPL39592.1 hypothetical protein QX183_03530 [Malacoplasma iowae]